VKTFVNTITIFPVGSLVRTNRNELGLVVQTKRREPLHPVLALVDEGTYEARGEWTRLSGSRQAATRDTSRRACRRQTGSICGCSSSPQRQPDLP